MMKKQYYKKKLTNINSFNLTKGVYDTLPFVNITNFKSKGVN